MTPAGIDPRLFADFIDEALDSLGPLDRILLDLSSKPDPSEGLAAVFRPVHSLKGNAGFFRLMSIKKLAHLLENVMDAMRHHKLVGTPEIIETLLTGFDALRTMLRRVRNNEPEVHDAAKHEALLERVNQALTGGAKTAADPLAVLQNAAKLFQKLSLSKQPKAEAHWDSLQSLLSDYLPSASLGGTKSSGAQTTGCPPAVMELLTALEPELTRALPKDQAEKMGAWLAQLESMTVPDAVATRLKECRSAWNTAYPVLGFDPILRDVFLEQLRPLQDGSLWGAPEKGIPIEDSHSELPVAPTAPPVAAMIAETDRSMRVPEKSIDGFLGYVGELVVVEEVFQYLNRQLGEVLHESELAQRFRQNLDTFSSLSRALRESILALRRVPARQLLQKVPRLAHEVAQVREKQIRLELVGEELGLDKSHLDLLDAPITHLVNNAVDHGIELPARRVELGKSPEGLLRVCIRESEDSLLLEIVDDGAGLNLERLREKAISLGMIHSGQIMGNDQLVSLLFLPGVSTAEQVTDVSGRGVGMDVVRREIHNAGGRIEVETTAGKGTTFRVILPRSVHTQIIEGFVVRSGTGSYLFPLPLVGEVFPMTPELAHSIPGRGEVISRLDTILPLLRLDHALHTAGVASNEKSERDCGTVVVLQLEGGRLALLADEVLGIRKTVVKDLGEVGSDAKVFEGVGMMGDGSMSLILGANGIASLTKEAMLAV